MNQSWIIKDLLAISRASFLALIPAVLFPAMVLSYQLTGQLAIDLFVLFFLAALAAQIAVNALNEYQDFTAAWMKPPTVHPLAVGVEPYRLNPGLPNQRRDYLSSPFW